MPSEVGEVQLPEVERVEVQVDQLRGFTHEEDFTALSVDLLREVASHVCIAASLLPGDTRSWNRNQAVVGGIWVRLFKLLSAVLDQTCQHRRETMFIFLRLSFECVVNIRYFLSFGTDETYDAYIAYSLRHERRLQELIRENIAGRGGDSIPIERRMLRSIEKAFEKSGLKEEEVSPSAYRLWKDKTLFDRARDVGLEDAYLAMVGGPSHSVHGNWQDLLEYHLSEENGGFSPVLDWHPPRPQPLFAIGALTLDAVEDYVRFLVGSDAQPVIDDLHDLQERLTLADREHERFLTTSAS